MKKKLAMILSAAIVTSLLGTCGIHADALSVPEPVVEEAAAGIGSIVEESDKDNFETLDEESKLAVLDPESEEAAEKGLSNVAGVLEEYACYYTYTATGLDEYVLLYFDPSSRIVSCYVDILDLSKAYYSYDYVTNLNLNSIIPGFSSMGFADAYLLDCGDFYRLMIYFENLNDPNNVYALVQSGFVQMDSGYSNGALINADASDATMRAYGAYKLSDYEISSIGLNP